MSRVIWPDCWPDCWTERADSPAQHLARVLDAARGIAREPIAPRRIDNTAGLADEYASALIATKRLFIAFGEALDAEHALEWELVRNGHGAIAEQIKREYSDEQ